MRIVVANVSLIIEIVSLLLEPFPVSSSGHALLFRKIVACFSGTVIEAPPSYFAYLLHGPTALVLLLYFWPSWRALLKTMTLRAFLHFVAAGIIAESMTAIFYGIFAYTQTAWFPLWFGFFITACALLSLKACAGMPRARPFSYRAALILGIVQGISLLPGISRFGSTFVAARWLRFCARDAFVYSFLLEFPISVAGFLKGVYKMHSVHANSAEILNPFIGFSILSAMGGAYAGFYYVQKLVDRDVVWRFGVYLCILACLSVFTIVVC
jgi:undecaprenyl-diphosphatase